MNISGSTNGDTLVLRVDEPRIDAAVAVRFKDRMRVLMESAHKTIILDLSNVTFMDSSGLGSVVAVRKNLGTGQNLVLAGLHDNVRKVFRLTRMDSVFDIVETAEAIVG